MPDDFARRLEAIEQRTRSTEDRLSGHETDDDRRFSEVAGALRDMRVSMQKLEVAILGSGERSGLVGRIEKLEERVGQHKWMLTFILAAIVAPVLIWLLTKSSTP